VPSRRLLPLAVAALALLVGACGGDAQRRGADRTTVAPTVTTKATHANNTGSIQPRPTAPPIATVTKATIVAKNIAFSPAQVAIPVGQQVEITFDNEDASVPHNIHFMTPTPVKTDVKNGPESEIVKFSVAKKGKYKFTCDVHPTMNGTLTVA
jgi:plastocyanin